MAATSTKTATLEADVAAGVVVVTIRTAAVTKDGADPDTTDKAVRAKVCTTKRTKAPTIREMWAPVTKATEAGPTTAGLTTRGILLWYNLSHGTLRELSQRACARHRDDAKCQCRWFAVLKLLEAFSRVTSRYLGAKAL